MPKVRITLEAEIGDLPAFWPDYPPYGITRQNVFDVVLRIRTGAIEKLLESVILDEKTAAATSRFVLQEKELSSRLVNSFKFEIIKRRRQPRTK